MPFVDFDELDEATALPGGAVRHDATVRGRGVLLSRVRFPAGTGVGEHHHPEEQMVYVVAGRLRVVSGGEERVLGPGEGVHHPSSVEHSVQALEDTELITCKSTSG